MTRDLIVSDICVIFNGRCYSLGTAAYNPLNHKSENSVNVFGYEVEELFPLYITEEKELHGNLLRFSKDYKRHYLIRDLDRL